MAEVSTPSLEKSPARIREMFAGVAPRYDLLNHLLSGYLDVLWRRWAAAALDLPAGSLVLDLCCGTGDQALALARRGHRVVAADFCLPMLPLARRKFADAGGGEAPAGLVGDALALPFPVGSFDGTTVAFGLRNVADLDAALGAIRRMLRLRGRVAFLEFATPRPGLFRPLYLFYFRRVLPLVGRLLSPRGSAYSYLAASVPRFPQRQELLERMAAAGFGELSWRDLSGGAVCLYLGTAKEPR